MAKTPKRDADERRRILNCLPSQGQEADWPLLAAFDAGLADTALAPSIDRREPWWDIADQGQTGSCVGWAAADSVLRYHLVRAGWLPEEGRLSARFIWMAAKELDEFTSAPTTFIEPEGTSLKSALDVARKYGAVLESDLPFSGGQLSPDTAQTFYMKAARRKIAAYVNLGPSSLAWRRWLASTGPILTRLNVDQTWFDATTNPHLAAYQPDTAVGGHAVALVGYTPQGFIVRNSWGEGWGDDGFAYASNAYAAQAFTEAYGVVLGGPALEVETPSEMLVMTEPAVTAAGAGMDEVESAVIEIANRYPGGPFHLVDPVSTAFKDADAFDQYLMRLAARLHAGDRLNAVTDTVLKQLRKGRFDELAAWVRTRISPEGAAQ